MAEKWQPSNGTEQMSFVETYCMNCIHEKFQHTLNENDKKCDILSRTFLHDVKDPEYPIEWQRDENGQGICTAHQHWDWGDDDDDGGLKDPPDPVPPNQLSLFPLTPNEKDYERPKKRIIQDNRF